MYDLHLTSEQLEIRDTVREFVTREVKPVVLHPDRLQLSDRGIPMELLAQASELGLRTLGLSEASGGAGADALTACIVAEELGAGDADLAVILAHTSGLSHALFDGAMNDAQRARWLPAFLTDAGYHLAYASNARKPAPEYHRPAAASREPSLTAAREANGDWSIAGFIECIPNAPLAGLVIAECSLRGSMTESVLLVVPRDTPGLVITPLAAGPDADSPRPWMHGSCGAAQFTQCRVPAEHKLDAPSTLLPAPGRGMPLLPAVNLGIGRAAFEAAVDYGKLRVQGGRPIIEHEAIGLLLADIAIKLNIARSAVWQAAWAYDHPSSWQDRSLPDLPLATMAAAYTSEAVHQATLRAAEVFGAMGVMRDVPMHKYVSDALRFLHGSISVTAEKLALAEAIAGYRRPA